MTTSVSERRAPAPPAAFIVDAVGDVGRPTAGLPSCKDIEHLPGEGGMFSGITNMIGWARHGNAHLVDQQKRYGRIYRTKFGFEPIVCVSDPQMLMQIARNDDHAWSAALAWRFFFEGVDATTSTLDSPVTLDFEPHKEARKLLAPAFAPAATASYLDVASPMFEAAIDKFVKDGRVSFKSDIRRLLANVSLRIFTGVDDPKEGEMLDRALADFWAAPLALSKNPWISPTWRRAMAGHKRLRETLRARVDERRKSGGSDLFSRLCAESRGADWLDDDGLVRLFMGVMAGAFDTTSFALTSMAYLLAKHPDWQERLREEARSISSGRVTYEETKRMVVTDRAWKETLRLFPVASDLPRRALHDVQLGEWRIPAGAFILAMIGPVLQDPTWWTEPTKFDPDRFSDDRAEDKKHKGLFLPFGAGAHACIGSNLANIEAKTFWHAMLTRCRFRLERDYEGQHRYGPLGVVSGDVALTVEKL
jgi:cytochrome P450